MNRITNKLLTMTKQGLLYDSTYMGVSIVDLYNKLQQLEDVEEEIGIDLVTLFKALKNGIFGKIGTKIEHILAPHFSWHKKEIYIFKIIDYGKTWALTKEELDE